MLCDFVVYEMTYTKTQPKQIEELLTKFMAGISKSTYLRFIGN
jgi:hypothetical protein